MLERDNREKKRRHKSREMVNDDFLDQIEVHRRKVVLDREKVIRVEQHLRKLRKERACKWARKI